MPTSQFNRNSPELYSKISKVFQKRAQNAFERFATRWRESTQIGSGDFQISPAMFWKSWIDGRDYLVDLSQRSVLFWDTLRKRGDNFLDHEKAGKPPVLHFEYETVLDARTFDRPVNYALVKIKAPSGVTFDPKRRPYVVIDPRAGHGPGIGGFKDDSQVGVALKEGHPVYFVIFFPDPEPGQTLIDVCAAEAKFIRHVRQLHPDSPKPVILGNCQGGWAAMMLAASNPEDTGAIVINGAPMSYWGGAWSEGEGDNPMRYAGGMLGGTWLASLAADLGNGKFDGANLVQNMENLNPANTLWDKYYHLFANVDTEGPRFLEFERWWGGFFLMNREEIDWITQNLFVGNKLWETKGDTGALFDLKAIQVPIILFASLGDNITPPQQAFNWVADVYKSTDEIKALGQTIVGLLHKDIGHLGIFVSGRVAKKEHTQIVSVLKSIEALPPGLYGMEILEKRGSDGKTDYNVEFVEHRLEDVMARLNRFERVDEKPFAAAAMISEFNQRAYDLFLSPLIKAMANEPLAQVEQAFHPLRLQRWALSGVNPWLRWLEPAAEAIREQRRAVPPDQAIRQLERRGSDLLSASLDFYRDIRDAISEALFFSTYGSMFSFYLADKAPAKQTPAPGDGRQTTFVKEALSAIANGGYAEALARAGSLLAVRGEPLPLSRLQLKKELLTEYQDFLPDLPPETVRRIRGEQDIIVTYEREAAIDALPLLLTDMEDRKRFLGLLERLPVDPRILSTGVTPQQTATLERIRSVLSAQPAGKSVIAATPPATGADQKNTKLQGAPR